MNPKDTKVHIDAQILKLLFFRYKDVVIPSVITIIVWLLFFQFVIPQIQNIFTLKDQVAASEGTLATLSENYNTIASFDSTSLQNLTGIANTALPSVKDFAGILNTISLSAAASQVILSDYTFSLGDLNNITGINGNQSVTVTLTVKGNTAQIQAFLISLSKAVPLSEVTSVTIDRDTAAITTNFFFSALPKITFVPTNPLPVITNEQKSLLTSLASNTSQVNTTIVTPTPQLSTATSSSSSK